MPSAAYIAPMGWQVLAGLTVRAVRGLISLVVFDAYGGQTQFREHVPCRSTVGTG